ncbi:MAG: hypothetical protein JXX28_12900 [Deltaproteobacteria bacterium]|nr:hypothetical protein [Deltaproteobacteria bacterium]
MPTNTSLAHDVDLIKATLIDLLEKAVPKVLDEATSGANARSLELTVWSVVLDIGAQLLQGALGTRCRRSFHEDLERRGIQEEQVRLRTDADYHAKVTTTFGAIRCPLFAYRVIDDPGHSVTHCPARKEVFPLLPFCHSSEVLVEWESRMGSEMPFRRAQETLTFFSHGAVTVEDTTLARHMLAAGRLIDASWQYRSVQEIRRILKERAVCDADTGRPLLYVSSDAHALRRYVDETWDASWKMANGLRLWCLDRENGGRIIHLGGEYTWGDAAQVEALFRRLQTIGLLPVDGDYGEGVHAQIVFPTDGAPWLRDRILPLFPDAIGILDPWHLMER